MTCRETSTLDLAEFLARPTAPQFAAFRAHYPRCADCAAEVRAWTELHAALSGATHPSPEVLLQYEDGRLPEADRDRLARHLATCAPCRDELRALAVFDRDAAPAAARVVAIRLRRRLFRLPELVLHPALAYGLVLALLFYPALRSRFDDRRLTEEAQAPASSSIDRAPEPKLADRLAAGPREERAALAKKAAPTQPAAEAPRAARAPTKSDASEREIDAADRVGRLRTLSSDVAAGSARSSREPDLLPGPSADQFTLRLPVHPALRGVGPLEIRVVDERSERELRERVTAVTDRVEINVPRVWLLPGRYRVEVSTIAEPSKKDEFALDVES